MTRPSRSGTEQFRDLVQDLGKMPAALRSELRPALKESAARPLAAAKQNASWSRRIPGAIAVKVSFSAKSAGVYLRVSKKKAPHARAYEHGGKLGTFRHRVYGHNVWVAERARPFLWPAAEPWLEHTDELIGAVVDTVAHDFDFN